MAAGRLPVARGHELSADDSLRAHVIERIMCDGAVDLAAAGRAFGFAPDWWAAEEATLAELQADGLLALTRDGLALRHEAMHLTRIVASVFDTYFADAAVRHSVAV